VREGSRHVRYAGWAKTGLIADMTGNWCSSLNLYIIITNKWPYIHCKTGMEIHLLLVCTIGQAVSLRLPTAAARVRTQFWSCGICEQSGSGAGFLKSTSVSPANSNSTACSTFIIIRGWYNRPISGQRTKWIQSHPTP
jgi:hypothetical protein